MGQLHRGGGPGNSREEANGDGAHPRVGIGGALDERAQSVRRPEPRDGGERDDSCRGIGGGRGREDSRQRFRPVRHAEPHQRRPLNVGLDRGGGRFERTPRRLALQVGERLDGGHAHLPGRVGQQPSDRLGRGLEGQSSERLAGVVAGPGVGIPEPAQEIRAHPQVPDALAKRAHGGRARSVDGILGGGHQRLQGPRALEERQPLERRLADPLVRIGERAEERIEGGFEAKVGQDANRGAAHPRLGRPQRGEGQLLGLPSPERLDGPQRRERDAGVGIRQQRKQGGRRPGRAHPAERLASQRSHVGVGIGQAGHHLGLGHRMGDERQQGAPHAAAADLQQDLRVGFGPDAPERVRRRLHHLDRSVEEGRQGRHRRAVPQDRQDETEGGLLARLPVGKRAHDLTDGPGTARLVDRLLDLLAAAEVLGVALAQLAERQRGRPAPSLRSRGRPGPSAAPRRRDRRFVPGPGPPRPRTAARRAARPTA